MRAWPRRAALCLVLMLPLAAQEEDWGAGEEDLVAGRYTAALTAYREALQENPKSWPDRYGLVRTLLATGRYSEAEKVLQGLLREKPGAAHLHVLAGRLAFRRGRLEEAERSFRAALKAAPGHFEARARLGELLWWRGRRAEARRLWETVAGTAAARVVEDPEDLLYLGVSYEGLGRLAEASEVYIEAARGDPELYEAYVRLIRLYLRNHHVYGPRPAYLPVRDEILRLNPHHPELHLVLADVYVARMEHDRARRHLRQALAVNPHLTHGLALEASFAIDRMDFAAAERFLARGLAVNPRDKELLSYRAALRYIRDDPQGAEALWRRVLALDPRYGEAFVIAAELFGGLRRYEEARRMAERAVAVAPRLWRAWDAAARFRLHTGHEKEALQALRRAVKGDPFGDRHPWRHNLLELFRHLDEFLLHRWGPFEVRLHATDNPVLKPYVRAALTQVHRTLAEKYRFRPEGPIRVEIFHKASDFAVRTVGVPGLHGLLGACFGRVITMKSPRALPPRSYIWRATLWHEFAHVITLQLSRYRLPRWLTEGLSVYEEACRNAAWVEPEDYELVNALANDRLIPVAELDEAFRTARIAFAYLQSYHLVRYIAAEQGGFERLRAMLTAYAAGKDTPTVLRELFGLSPRAFDRAFRRYLEARYGSTRIQPRYTGRTAREMREVLELDPRNVDALRTLAWYYYQQGPDRQVDCEACLGRLLALRPEDPSGLALRGALFLRQGRPARAREFLGRALAAGWDEYFLRLRLARLAEAAGRQKEAVKHYRAAKERFPWYVGRGNPYLALARLYRALDRPAAARRELEAYLRRKGTDVAHRKELAREDLEAGRAAAARRWLEEALGVDPYDIEVHRLLGRACGALGAPARGLKELERALLLWEETPAAKRPPRLTRADLELDRARLLRRMGREEEARAAAAAALRQAPHHAGLRAFLQGK